VFLLFDNSAHHVCAHDAAVACHLAMAEVQVQLPLGALNRQDVGKPGIPPGTDSQRWSSEARDRGFNSRRPDFIAVGPVLVRAGAC
jgi:hypothetical protein